MDNISTVDFKDLWDNEEDLDGFIREALDDEWYTNELAAGVSIEISGIPETLSDAETFLVDKCGYENPEIYNDVDEIFYGKSHSEILSMMWYGSEDFCPSDEYFTINAYGNFGPSSNDRDTLLEQVMPETCDVLEFAEEVQEKVDKIVSEVVKEAKKEISRDDQER